MPAKKIAASQEAEGDAPLTPPKRRGRPAKRVVAPEVTENVAAPEQEAPAAPKRVVKRAPRKVKPAPAVGVAAGVSTDEPVISIVIPAYNEGERLVPTLIDAHTYFTSLKESFEVIVVDDGSIDRTREIVERLAVDMPELRLVVLAQNSGKGAAVARGMLEARGAVRLFADADGSTPFTEFPKLGDALGAGAAVAFGSRATKDSVLDPAQPLPRVMLGRLSNLLIQATNLPGVRDTQCGFKLFTAPAAEAIFPLLTQTRWGFDIETLVLARRLGFPIAEIGVYWQDRADSTLRPNAYLQTLLEDLRIRYNALTGAYPKR